MKIYDAKGSLIKDIDVDDNSYRYRAVMGEHSLTLYFSLAEHLEIPVGAYCEFQGETYTLLLPEHLKMIHKRNFEYAVTFGSDQDRAKHWKLRNTVDGRLKFALTAKPKEHLQMIVDNLNLRDSGWSVGDCINDTEKVISYDHDFIWDALTRIADTCETEFEISHKTVSLKRVEYFKSSPLPLSYGKGKGFKSGIGRSNSNDKPPVEILYVQGGERNIDKSKYGHSELLLPTNQRLRYDGEHFEDESGFNAANARTYVSSADGFSIQRADKSLSSHSEDSLDRSDDYPKRVGKVTSLLTVNQDNHFYDIVDSTIPDSLNYEKCLIEGETMTIIFQSGMLAGKEFEVKYHHDPKRDRNGNITKLGKRFEIVPQEIDGMTMPSGSFVPKSGSDTYAVFGCQLPDAYICDNTTKSGASWDMFRAAVRYLYDNEEHKFTFTGELDGIWAKKDWENIGGRLCLGGYILFSDDSFQKEGVAVRIVGIKEFINKPHSPKIELSNETVSASVSSTLKDLASQDVEIMEKQKESIQFTKRRFRDAKETISMLEEAMLDNFTQSIQPVAVETMSLLVGDESLQYVFTQSLNSNTIVDPNIRYDATEKKLTVSTCYIKHMTLGITTIQDQRKDSDYKRWSMQPYTSSVLDETESKYYLYAKVSKSGNTGSFLLSKTAIKLEGVSGYYHLLVGILNSEYDGERSFASLYGFTEVLPGRVTTDKIISNDGNTWFDLTKGEIQGTIKFKSGQTAEDYIGDKVKGAIDDANTAVTGLKEYVDGAFEDGIISQAEAKAIEKYINQVNATKEAVDATYKALYNNPRIPDFECTVLLNAKNTFDTAVENLITAINTAIADGKTTSQEKTAVDNAFSEFGKKHKAFNTAVEEAYIAIENALNQAAQDAADSVRDAVNDLNSYVDGAFEDGIISQAEAKAIEKYINQVNATKEAVDATYSELYKNDYLPDSECTSLATSKKSFDTAVGNLITAINTAIADGKTTAQEKANVDDKYAKFNTAYKDLSYWIEVCRQTIENEMKSATDYQISSLKSKVYSKVEMDKALKEAKEYNSREVGALQETLIDGGYIRTGMIRVDELIVRHLLAGENNGQRVEIDPMTKAMSIYDKDDNLVSVFEGNNYSGKSKLFGNTSGSLSILSRTETFGGYDSGITLGKGSIRVDGTGSDSKTGNVRKNASHKMVSSFYTATPTEVYFNVGSIQAYAYSPAHYGNSNNGSSRPTLDGIQEVSPLAMHNAMASMSIVCYTYSDSGLTNLIESRTIFSVGAYASSSNKVPNSDGYYEYDSQNIIRNLANRQGTARVVAGYHVLTISYSLSASVQGNYAYLKWGSAYTGSDLSGGYKCDFYVSRYFSNGLCLGRREDDYAMIYLNGSQGMFLTCENNGNGFEFGYDGIKTRLNGSTAWKKQPVLLFRGLCSFAAKSGNLEDRYTLTTYFTFDGNSPTITRTEKGKFKLTYPSSWSRFNFTLYNLMVHFTGYQNQMKGTLDSLTGTYLTASVSDDETVNDNNVIIDLWYCPNS